MLAQASEAIIGGGAIVGAALITGPLVWMLKQFDKRNTQQHQAAQAARAANNQELADTRTAIDGTRDDVGEVKDVVLEHIAWHAHGARLDTADRS